MSAPNVGANTLCSNASIANKPNSLTPNNPHLPQSKGNISPPLEFHSIANSPVNCRKLEMYLNGYDKGFSKGFFLQYEGERVSQAMFLFAFNAFARIGEITLAASPENNLQLSDIAVEGDKSHKEVHVTFQRFKHNTNCSRHRIMFGHGPTRISASQSLEEYLKVRGNGSGPLLVNSDNSPVTRSQFDTQLHACLKFCKLDSSRYKGHSFRIGAASLAAEQGYSDAKICAMGRWKSSAFRKYVRANTVA
ncbi:uncharacterized protein [Argopecten irradians]|uniref:uncharacterized protein n=1 Tax=Argopecten irradians TaxID=31199 RepID=UPI00371D3990